MLTYRFHTNLSDALKWRTFLRISLLLLVLICSLFMLDLEFNQKQFQTHRQNIQAQYAFQLERLVESSADKMIQISGAASLNDGLVKAIQTRQVSLINKELDTLDWYLQADAGLTIVGLFDSTGQVFDQYISMEHSDYLSRVIQHESPAWQVDCSETCQIVSYTPLLVDGSLLAVLVLAEPLSHVLLRFHHVANIDTGLLTTLDVSGAEQSGLGNWERYLAAATSPEQSRTILSQASEQFSLEELLQEPRTIDLNNHIYELKALPFNSSQLVVMTEASSDYERLAQAKDTSIKWAIFLLVLGEILLLVFLWSPLSRLTFSERLVALLSAKRFDDIKYQLEQRTPEQKKLVKAALNLEDEFASMQSKLVQQAARIDSITGDVIQYQTGLSQVLDELNIPVMLVNTNGLIQFGNAYLKAQLCIPTLRLLDTDISTFIQADSQFKSRLDDVLSGRVNEFQHHAQCFDAQGDSHTYRWRYSIFHAPLASTKKEERCLLVIGQPLSQISQDQQRRWCHEHDLDTAWLNTKGFLKAVNALLPIERQSQEFVKKHLMLVRFPACLVQENYVDRLVFLKFLNESFSAINHNAASCLSRIEENEFAFFVHASDDESELETLKNKLSKGLSQIKAKANSQSYHIAHHCLTSLDLYALDLLAKARSNYVEHYY